MEFIGLQRPIYLLTSALCRSWFPLIDINCPDGVFALSHLVSSWSVQHIFPSSVPLSFFSTRRRSIILHNLPSSHFLFVALPSWMTTILQPSVYRRFWAAIESRSAHHSFHRLNLLTFGCKKSQNLCSSSWNFRDLIDTTISIIIIPRLLACFNFATGAIVNGLVWSLSVGPSKREANLTTSKTTTEPRESCLRSPKSVCMVNRFNGRWIMGSTQFGNFNVSLRTDFDTLLVARKGN